MADSRMERQLREAEAAAAFLDQVPRGKFHANQVRSLARSLRSSSKVNSCLHRDNMQLRAKLTPIALGDAKAAAAKAALPLGVELTTTAAQLKRMAAAAEFGGDDVSVRVTDSAYLIDLLERAAKALPQ